MLSHGVAQCCAKMLVVEDLFFQDQQGRGGALLAAVAEGRMQDVLDGQVAIGEHGDDGGVLAARFGQQVQIGLGL